MATYLKLNDIKSINYIDYNIDTIYDLHVNDNHNYFLFVNGKKILVHNSGKTLGFVRSIWNRAAAAPNSRHLILRSTHRAIKNSIFKGTFHDLKRLEKDRWSNVTLWKSELSATFENKSEVICSGLDDNRIDSILGNEYCTIYFNEASEITFDVYETVLSRLAQVCYYEKDGEKKQLNLKVFIDCNPPSTKHWLYSLFYKGIKPDNTPLKHADKYGKIKLNPGDNKENLPPKYYEILDTYTGKKKKRFVLGQYTDDTEGALFKQAWIDDNRCKWDNNANRYILPELEKIVIGVDPATTNKANSDETGIIIAGSKRLDDDTHYYLLNDFTGRYSPKEWADIIINQYSEYKANEVVAESNQGGDLVARNIHAENNNIPIELVHGAKGKEIRAEPVSNLCERGYIHFYGMLVELEQEITEWIPSSGMKSPNRLDAMVWAVLHLIGDTNVVAEDFAINNADYINQSIRDEGVY